MTRATALTAFNNYRPGEFLNKQVVEEIAETRQQRNSRRHAGIKAASGEDDDE